MHGVQSQAWHFDRILQFTFDNYVQDSEQKVTSDNYVSIIREINYFINSVKF